MLPSDLFSQALQGFKHLQRQLSLNGQISNCGKLWSPRNKCSAWCRKPKSTAKDQYKVISRHAHNALLEIAHNQYEIVPHLICEGRCWLKGKCRSRALIVAAVPNIFEEIRLLLEWLEQFAPIQQAKGPDWLHSLGGQ